MAAGSSPRSSPPSFRALARDQPGLNADSARAEHQIVDVHPAGAGDTRAAVEEHREVNLGARVAADEIEVDRPERTDQERGGGRQVARARLPCSTRQPVEDVVGKRPPDLNHPIVRRVHTFPSTATTTNRGASVARS
jgi:hypothetical protein